MKRLLLFLGLLDDNEQLSRTNLAVYVALGSMVQAVARGGTIDYTTLGAFLIAMVSYQAKRAIVAQAQDTATQAKVEEHEQGLLAHTQALSQVTAAVTSLKQSLQARKVL